MKNRVRLLRIISTLNPKYGGPSKAIIDNSLYLKTKGIKVDIITNDPFGSKFYKGNKLKIINVGSKYLPISFNPFLFFWILKNKKKYNNFVVHGIWELNTIIANGGPAYNELAEFLGTGNINKFAEGIGGVKKGLKDVEEGSEEFTALLAANFSPEVAKLAENFITFNEKGQGTLDTVGLLGAVS